MVTLHSTCPRALTFENSRRMVDADTLINRFLSRRQANIPKVHYIVMSSRKYSMVLTWENLFWHVVDVDTLIYCVDQLLLYLLRWSTAAVSDALINCFLSRPQSVPRLVESLAHTYVHKVRMSKTFPVCWSFNLLFDIHLIHLICICLMYFACLSSNTYSRWARPSILCLFII